jgi:hypothetical protein
LSGFGETEPSDLQKSLVDEALYLRGRIVAAYAQVEFLLADLVVKLDVRFPYLIDKRIKAVKRIAERPGYSDYKQELNAVCEELSHYDDLRHFMTHGFIRMETGSHGNHRFEMLRRRSAKTNRAHPSPVRRSTKNLTALPAAERMAVN